MDEKLREALARLIAIRDNGNLFDRLSDGGGYTSQELEHVQAVTDASFAGGS